MVFFHIVLILYHIKGFLEAHSGMREASGVFMIMIEKILVLRFDNILMRL